MSLSFTGWTPSVFHRSASTLNTGPASGGSVQAGAGTNTASNLMAGNTSGSATGDAGLHSRQFMNPLTGHRDVVATGSVYGQANVPAYLQQAVNSLNVEQMQRQNALTAFQNQLLARFDTGFGHGPNQYLDALGADTTGGRSGAPAGAGGGAGANTDEAYLAAEALRALAVQPGAHVTFGQAVQNPKLGAGYLTQSNSVADLNQSKATAIDQSNNSAAQVAKLQAQRDNMARMGQPTYQLDNQILQLQQNPTGIATAAAGSQPGWTPAPPRF